MAALSDSALARIVDLRYLRSGDLDPLLDEETQVWQETLEWDFRASASLVRRFLDMQALNGYALLMNGHPVGYCYYVSEERKGLIGDLYLMKDFVSVESEERLLGAVIDCLVKTPYVQRIESQLMMLRNGPRMALPQRAHLRVYSRTFMEIDLARISSLPDTRATHPVLIDNWTERKQDEAATLIAAAYQGHIDAEINDQYRSPAGARRFLTNIIQYPGCGSFFQPGSFVALDQSTAKLCGICLSSLVHSEVGHITQVCVSKAVRGRGVGYQLIRRSLESLARHGCRKASLTVTSDNQEAIAVYERMGFRKARNFAAYVWSGFSGRS
ncbi:MAG TPA: GNAT family N-acetyltransferase [Bryobacteraceae bacterium]|nr:GNAT family N-acetyltransferase [Bryobacteraceae bacterium]